MGSNPKMSQRISEILNSGQFYCLMGAPLDTGNLGVSALALSVIESIAKRHPNWVPVLLDYSRGEFLSSTRLSNGEELELVHIGTSVSRRFWRTDNLNFIRFAQQIGFPHNALKAFRNSQSVLDISGGDSFTDLYGPRRFEDMTVRKQLALRAGGKLILLPQTYGPYSTDQTFRVASELVQNSIASWARDGRSFETLNKMMNGKGDEGQARLGVDVAFGLPLLPPDEAVQSQVKAWSEDSLTTVGINVSGLIYNGGEDAQAQYGLKGNYRELVDKLVRKFLADESVRVVLVPHVIPPNNPVESDLTACEAVRNAVPQELQSRLEVIPALSDPRCAKWVISHCDWFCGTRMHSTIASLSTQVPTGALAYSLKTKGVFETCDCGDCVIELRDDSVETCVQGMWDCFQRREEIRETLASSIPRIAEQVEEQADSIVRAMEGIAHSELVEQA